jgi:hypothetical protein
VVEDAIEAHWLAQVRHQGKHGPFGKPLHYAGDGDPITTSLLQAHLPNRIVAYTSGAEVVWQSIEQPVYHPDPLEEGQGSILDDRPSGWTIRREQEEERIRVTNVTTYFSIKASGRTVTNSLESLTNLKPGTASGGASKPSFLVRQGDLRLAAIALSLWQLAQEFIGVRRCQEPMPYRQNGRLTAIDSLSDMIPELQFEGMWIQIVLNFKIGLVVFSHVVIDQGDRHNEREMTLLVVIENFQQFPFLIG